MPCFIDGQPIAPPQPVPRQIVLVDQTLFGDPKTISIDWVATFDVRLEQLTMHWSGVGGLPTTPEDMILMNGAAVGTAFDVIFRSLDPSVEPLSDVTILTPFRWIRNDHVKLDYPNSDDLGIGAQLILREVF